MTNSNETIGQVIFDVDGVFTTDRDPAKPAFEHVICASLDELNAKVPNRHDKITLHWGTGPKRIFLKLLEESLQQEKASEQQQQLTRHEGIKIFDELMYSDFDEMTCAVPGVAVALERLRDVGVKLAINSASELKILRDITFPKAGISLDLFDEDLVWTSDRLLGGLEKPSPYPIHQILMSSGIPRERTAMVGDSPSDIFCAQQASVSPLVVLTGNIKDASEAAIYDVRPDQVIEDISNLDEIVYHRLGWASLTGCGVSA